MQRIEVITGEARVIEVACWAHVRRKFVDIFAAKLNSLDVEAYLHDVLIRISDYPVNRVAGLLPWNIS